MPNDTPTNPPSAADPQTATSAATAPAIDFWAMEDQPDHANPAIIWALGLVWGFLCGLLIGWLIWG